MRTRFLCLRCCRRPALPIGLSKEGRPWHPAACRQAPAGERAVCTQTPAARRRAPAGEGVVCQHRTAAGEGDLRAQNLAASPALIHRRA